MNARSVLGLLLFASAVLGGQRVMQSSQVMTGVWVATTDVPADAILGPADLRIAEVRLPADLQGSYAGSATEVTGAILTRPVAAGEMLPLQWLVPAGSIVDGRALTIPVAPEHAVGGLLRPGDRVDVLATFDSTDKRARTLLLASALEVMDVTTTGGFVADDATVTGITVMTTAQDAVRLAFAIRSGEIDLVKVVGSAGDQEVSPVNGGDL